MKRQKIVEKAEEVSNKISFDELNKKVTVHMTNKGLLTYEDARAFLYEEWIIVIFGEFKTFLVFREKEIDAFDEESMSSPKKASDILK